MWNGAAGIGTESGITLLFPNPSNGNLLNLRFYLDGPSQIVLRIFDAMGREIFMRDLGLVTPDPGFNELSWDQKDRQGGGLASGIYWATLEIDGLRSVKKFTVIH